MKAIVPFRGIKTGKTRLRERLEDKAVERLLEEMLSNTLTVLHALHFEPVIVTADVEVKNDYPREVIILDAGESLQGAISQALDNFDVKENILFVMPDLPFINVQSLEHFCSKKGERKVVPAFDGGIAIAYGKPKWIRKIPFGKDSFKKLSAIFPDVEVIWDENLGFDLDTYEDFLKWKNMVKES
ncbi:MAG: hypothetical protein D6732_19440 [Methanobacteriota archaeon]|nr:MAG: hypothetical protein D6732_19440 [Euryarchaeota archaeon]